MKNRLVLLVSLLCVAPAYGNEQETALREAEQRWQQNASASYRYTYFKECDCYRDGPPLTVVSVIEAEVDSVAFIRPDSNREITARDDAISSYWTIDELFDRIAGAIERQAELRVDYHETLGYPLHLYIDYNPDFVGDETDLRLTGVEFR